MFGPASLEPRDRDQFVTLGGVTWSQSEGVDVDAVGSWTVRRKEAKRGAEPDQCYVRGVYQHYMPSYASMNALNAELPMPDFFWTGERGDEQNNANFAISEQRAIWIQLPKFLNYQNIEG